MKTATKTNYSPVKQMTQAKLHNSSPVPMSRNETRQATINFYRDVNVDKLDNREDLPEEVYIYNCCGVSKQLDPSMRHMPTYRGLFFFFNCLVFLFGFANLGMGLWFRIDPKVYEIHKYIETQNFTIAGWIILFAGFLSCLMALLGCGAAMRQFAGLLVFYFTTLIALTLSLVGALVLLTVYGLGSTLEHFLIKEVYEQIRRRSMNSELDMSSTGDATQFLDFIQVKMRCCGAYDFQDYGKLGMIVPATCYTIDKNYILGPGCGRAMRRLFDIRAGLAIGFTSGSIVSQIATIVLSALMFCAIYNYRSNPRPISPIPSNPHRDLPADLYQQRPRSRTPIAI